MTEYKIPTEPISKSDFDKQHCQEILEKAACNDYVSMYQAFSTASKQAMDNDDAKQGKIYWLLSDACSLIFSFENTSVPFKPLWIMSGRRSIIPEDFVEGDLDFFAEIVNDIEDVRLKARLADLVWLLRRDVEYALLAIDSYKKIPINKDTWIIDTDNCWHRSICLAIMLGSKTAGDQVKDMEKIMLEAFEFANEADHYFALQVVNLMSKFNLPKSDSVAISQKLEAFARSFEKIDNLFIAKDYFESAATWYKVLEDEAKQFEMIYCQAECCVKEARNSIANKEPSNIDAARFYEQAIQIFRSIPGQYRPNLKVGERMDEIYKLMNEAGQLSFGELAMISSPEIDISDCIKDAQNIVAGKDKMDAILNFSRVSEVIEFSKLQEEAIKTTKDSITSFFSGTHLSRDGRVIARTSGVDPSEPLTEETPEVHVAMMRHYNIHVGVVAQGRIIPALEVMHIEQRIIADDFLKIVKLSPIVPRDRIHLFVKGLFAGYGRDFATAIHILVPQLENIVRIYLKSAGVRTRNLSDNGIENENGLSALIKLPEIKKIFGDNLAFEIKALFCDGQGANLRNEIAHGLINYEEAYNSAHVVYAWWLILKLVFNAYWHAVHQQGSTAGESEKTDA